MDLEALNADVVSRALRKDVPALGRPSGEVAPNQKRARQCEGSRSEHPAKRRALSLWSLFVRQASSYSHGSPDFGLLSKQYRELSIDETTCLSQELADLRRFDLQRQPQIKPSELRRRADVDQRLGCIKDSGLHTGFASGLSGAVLGDVDQCGDGFANDQVVLAFSSNYLQVSDLSKVKREIYAQKQGACVAKLDADQQLQDWVMNCDQGQSILREIAKFSPPEMRPDMQPESYSTPSRIHAVWRTHGVIQIVRRSLH